MFALGISRVVHTGLSAEQAAKGLERAMVRGPLFALDRPEPGSAPLRGTIDGRRFSVVRRAQFRNSFTPVVEGEVVPGEVGCQVQLSLGMHAVPFFTLVVWMATTLSLALYVAQLEALAELALGLAAVSVLGPAVGYLAWRLDVETVVQEISFAVTHLEPPAS
ncbi:MAG: hypothetical protein JNJ54_03325 [Myxococcaceae bacterium]|nr:hypothetical protein [Myxococcaceae bacterium]